MSIFIWGNPRYSNENKISLVFLITLKSKHDSIPACLTLTLLLHGEEKNEKKIINETRSSFVNLMTHANRCLVGRTLLRCPRLVFCEK